MRGRSNVAGARIQAKVKRTTLLYRTLLLFTFSGIGGLIFQIIWTRKLGLFLGSTIQSASLITANFLLGLSLGALVAGERGSKLKNPLKQFARLEFGVAASGLLTTYLIPRLHQAASLVADPETGFYRVVAILLASLLVLVPSLMMGATLPLLTEYSSRTTTFAKALALLYAVNTLGAALGALSTDFFLVKTIGVNHSAWLAAGLDFMVASFALYLSRTPIPETEPDDRPESSDVTKTGQGGWATALFLVAMSGFCGLGLEITWTRLLVFFNGTDIYAYSLVLGTYLLGIVLGSILFAKFSHKVESELTLAALLMILGVWVWLSLLYLDKIALLVHTLTSPETRTLRRLVSCFVMLLVPTSILGLIFPAAAQMLHNYSQNPAQSVGRSYIANTFGSVGGSLLAGFAVLPFLGLQVSLQFFASVGFLTGTFLLLKRRKIPAALGSLVLLIAAWFLTPPDHLLKLFYERPGTKVIYAKDDHYGAVAILEEFDVDEAQSYRNLIVDGYNMAGNNLSAQRYTAQLAALPTAFASEPKTALVVALGLANTLTALESFDSVEHIDCVELSPKVVEAIGNIPRVPPVLNSPKVNLIIGDGRHYLLTTSKKYDIITSEPPPPTEAGIVNLYSREYFELCRSRLNPGGAVAHWLPVMQMSVFEEKTIIKSFQEVFPYTYLFHGSGLQLILVGRMEPIEPNLAEIEQRLKGGAPLEKAGLLSAYDVLASYLAGPEELQQYTVGIPPLTDDHPYLQYHDGNWQPDVGFLLQPRPPLMPSDLTPESEKLYKAAVERGRLIREYQIRGVADQYVLFFRTTELGRLLLEGSEDSWTQVMTASSPEHVEYLKSRPESALRDLKLARIASLQGDEPLARQYLDSAEKLASNPQEKRFVLYCRLLLLEESLSEEERAKFKQELEALPPVTPAFEALVEMRFRQ